HGIREHQWREAFASADGSWFAVVLARPNGELVGFAKGTRSDHPEFPGQLNKVYLRRDYQRLGLGRRLVGHVVRRFVSQGVASMILFADPRNPSCAFFEALGAERVLDDAGRFQGAYGWHDLPRLARLCPID
ncbi:MAG: GNAT family N-acetyltransferase, partial [Acidimicrobiales bacterium]